MKEGIALVTAVLALAAAYLGYLQVVKKDDSDSASGPSSPSATETSSPSPSQPNVEPDEPIAPVPDDPQVVGPPPEESLAYQDCIDQADYGVGSCSVLLDEERGEQRRALYEQCREQGGDAFQCLEAVRYR